MKALYITMIVAICVVAGCGSAESVGYFLGGLETGVTLAKNTTEKLNETIADANETNDRLIAIKATAEGIIKDLDPNQLAVVAELLKQDPNQVENIVTGIIETYNEANGAVATIKEKSKQPSYWIALVAALTAAYQKRKRMLDK